MNNLQYLHTFESFNDSVYLNAQNREISFPVSDDIMNELLDTDWDRSFGTEEEAKNHINYFLEYEFPELPDNVLLYRVLKLENVTDFDKENIGTCFTLNKELVYDEYFLDSIGVNEFDGDLYVLTVEVKKSDISVFFTIQQQLLNKDEEEISVKKSANIKIIEIEKIDS